MNFRRHFLLTCIAILSCSLLFAEARVTSFPQPNEDRYATEDLGNCTYAYGKDRTRYVQPYVTCKSGIEAFSLIPQEDGKWAILVSPADETERTDEEASTLSLNVSIKVDDHDSHEFSMIWPKKVNMVFDSLEFTEVLPLLDDLRRGTSMTVSRSGEDIEFNLERANPAIAELVLEQFIALSKVEKAENQ